MASALVHLGIDQFIM